MTRQFLIIISLLLIAICPAAAAESLPAAVQADSTYNARDYEGAVRLYHKAINDNGPTATIYYNLGNAYYRLGKLGRAVVYYERALSLDPSLTDARTNLDFVNTKILDKPEDDSSFLGNLHESIVSLMQPDAWAWTAFIIFLAMTGCLALYIFTGRVGLRKIGFFGSIILLFVWIYSMICAWSSSHRYDSHDIAIVIVPTAELATSPGTTTKDDKVVPVHEGTRLEIIDSLSISTGSAASLWYDVKINNATRAWVKASDIEKI